MADNLDRNRFVFFAGLRKLPKADRPFILICLLPYLAYTLPKIYVSRFFSFPKLLLSLLIICLADILFRKLFASRTLFTRMAVVGFTFILLFVTYGKFTVTPILTFVNDYFFAIRLWQLIMIVLGGMILIEFFLYRRKRSFFPLLNRTFVIFSIVIIAGTLFSSQPLVKETTGQLIGQNPLECYTDSSWENKPIIFITLDGYSSPEAFKNHVPDSGRYEFSHFLQENGWQVKNSLYSFETNTFQSISSLLNFNLSMNGDYKTSSEFTASENLLQARMIDSLEEKGVVVKNLSFFHLGKNKPIAYISPYPVDFFSLLTLYSYLPVIRLKTLDYEWKNFFSDASPIFEYNKKLFAELPAACVSDTMRKKFIYCHFWMPHNPISFGDEINIPDYSAGNYYKYWLFTNNKIKALLESMAYKDKYRVVIASDHGYRYDTRIDPHNAFAAFYNFDSSCVKNINSLQDIGILIKASFRK
jgi:hypothetical protein